MLDVYEPADAIFGAARYPCASGGGRLTTLPAAVWAYNHADWYVQQVLSLARAYGADASVSVRTGRGVDISEGDGAAVAAGSDGAMALAPRAARDRRAVAPG